MLNPLFVLVSVAIVIATISILVWWNIGDISRFIRALRQNERMIVEDALKHLYDCEYHRSHGTVQSLAGVLEMSNSRVVELTARLEAMGLLRCEEASLRLTDEGRKAALRMIRIHRLWETYLADRTGFSEAQWHNEADRREHHTSPDDVEQMVRVTGNPRFDPHGDPIPTPEGEVPEQRGAPLSDQSVGSAHTIVHVEDEPEAIYAQLRAEGIRVNQSVSVIEKSPEHICLEIDGQQHRMAPVVAANVWVVPRSTDVPIRPVDRLSSLQVGESRKVLGISPRCQGIQRRRFLDLGLVPGTEVTSVMKSPAGDPTGYRIRGALIALRREQAEMIHVELTTSNLGNSSGNRNGRMSP
ncbi:Iron-dependent repressor IdeR [Planctomycetes bacterium CA13]|uniref:Iron-dependent repressor IdeR n=1 Tax=Novipirellula herctigrandis TaxID=2527986 RepID=A0A5C5YUZ6_9BACT|nr:Iron-dependent repressor IdeR [Planctomycetes bacterium CA13]